MAKKSKINKENIEDIKQSIAQVVVDYFFDANSFDIDFIKSILTRDYICRRLNLVTEASIRKYFGSFFNFKKEFLEKYIVKPSLTREQWEDRQKQEEVEQQELNFEEEEIQPSMVFSTEEDQGEITADVLEDGITTSYKETEKYIYNPDTEEYIFDFTRDPKINGVIALSKDRVYAIERAYSNFDESPKTINDIALKQQMPPFVLRKVLRALDLTHDSMPLPKEYLDEEPDDDKIIRDLSSIRSFNIYEKFTHKKWKQTKEMAYKWIQYEKGQYQPLLDAVKNLNIQALPLEKVGINPYKVKRTAFGNVDSNNAYVSDDETYVICLSDLHFGVGADKDELSYSKQDINIQTTSNAVKSYLDQINTDLQSRCVRPARCTIISVGDIIHSLSGKTSRGTPLECSVIGPKQFKYAFNTLLQFFTGLYEMFPANKILVEACVGNHDGIGDSVLFTCLEAALQGKIKFYTTMSRYQTFRIGSHGFVIEHGDSYRYRIKKDTGSAKEARVNGIFLQNPRLNTSTSPFSKRYYITGHYHHFEYVEHNMFDEILLPSINPADTYADTSGYKNVPSQISFIVTPKGISHITRHTF